MGVGRDMENKKGKGADNVTVEVHSVGHKE